MKTCGLFNTRINQLRILAALASLVLAFPVQASFHLMQIEQVIGGVNGDTTAQAVQLRMRFTGENFVSGAQLVVVDAAGNNPITLATFPANVTNDAAGTRILITTSSFASHETSPISSDFTMTEIPASYLAAGRIVYQKAGIRWSLSWGGSGYTGPNTGTMDNDADGNFGPPFAGALPSNSTSALLFNGIASAPSTNNAADYSITTSAATVTNNAGDATSLIGGTPTPTPTPTASPSILGNISTRLKVETGDNALIGGFIITGAQPKKVIVRAIGPSLSSFFPGVLADPILELHGPKGFTTITNDSWRSDQEAAILATGIPPSDNLEAAIVATLPANNAQYTAIVRGVNDTTGIGVVEAYDLDPTVDSKLGNISTRGLVQTGDNVMIGGFIVVGQSSLRVIVRAIGPSLPVPGALSDPVMELHDVNGALIVTNDNWRSDQEAEIIATGIPPSSDLESAIVRNFAPGNYTAIVRGVNNATGVALFEAYGVN
jgi:hypothetical protein